jgi:hypothetical protein
MVIFGIVLALVLIYFGLIVPQDKKLRKIADDKGTADTKLSQIKNIIKLSESSNTELTDASYSLLQAENDVASGDIYLWTSDLISRFKKTYNVDIPSIGQPAISEVDVLPHFPYKQLRVSLSGTAYYHDFGKFIASFENTFPHVRVVNLVMDPVGGDSEKIAFRMDIIALVKSNP